MSELVTLPFKLGWVLLKTEVSKIGSAKVLRQLANNDEELILLQKTGKYWNQQNFFDRPDGLVVVTNQRLVFLSKLKTLTTTTDFLSFPLEMIESIEATRVMFVSPAIAFRVAGVKYMFTFFRNAAEVVELVNSGKRALLDRGIPRA
jgi:hypothetical protein